MWKKKKKEPYKQREFLTQEYEYLNRGPREKRVPNKKAPWGKSSCL